MKVAVVGATGAVGRQMLNDLQEVPNILVDLFASARSAGLKLPFRGNNVIVREFQLDAMVGYDFVLMSAGGAFSRDWGKQIASRGPVVIDNSSAWRLDPDVPLIVPEINGHLLRGSRENLLIANPNCSTIQLVVCLGPLDKAFGIEMVQVATYQSVSGSGQKGIDELNGQVQSFIRQEAMTSRHFAQPIGFNILPAIDVLDENGHCFEEEKIIRETRRILALPDLPVMATTARVPVFNCHSEAVTVKLKIRVKREDVEKVFADAPGIKYAASGTHATFPTPLTVVGNPGVFASRVRTPLRQEISDWVQFWVVADNLKKGAATNAVQIMDYIVRSA